MNAFTHFATPFEKVAAPRKAHDPRVEIRAGLALIALFGVGFVGWSAVARLDAAVHAGGVVKVAGSRQEVQSQAGGVVSAINVHEGDHVRVGQVLVSFGTAAALAQERSLASRVIGLQTEIARLGAELSGSAQVPAPSDWKELEGEERQMAARALAYEQTNLQARRALVQSERAVLRQRMAEVDSQITGYARRRSSNVRQGEINVGELSDVNSLYKKGYATKTRVLALERNAASIDGEIGSIDAEIARLHAVSGEAQLQILEQADQRARENTDRLRQAQTELQGLLPQWRAAREELSQTEARAPVSGTVLGLAVNSVGGVLPRGGRLMDVVPDKGVLEIETQIAAAEANDVKRGQPADVHIGGASGRNLPPLHGVVARVSADSLTDERTGRTYFTATIQVPAKALDAVARQAAADGAIKPGTPADVVIPLKRRTALEYWAGPLVARMRSAMIEQ